MSQREKVLNILLLVMLGIFFLVLMSACGRHEKAAAPASAPAPESSVQRVIDHLDSDNFIVSRDAAGNPAAQGDSLLFTGLALGLLPCDKAAAIEAALINMITLTTGPDGALGHLYRHPSLVRDGESDDGKIGVYWGLKRYIHRCGVTYNWVAALNLHRKVAPPELYPLIDDLLHDLSARPPLTDATRAIIADLVAGWARATVENHAAAYRIHLGLLALDNVGTAPGISEFCSQAQPADMPLVDAFCGNSGPLAAFAQNFVPDQWEYALQRSMAWEASPDGDGLSRPGLDLLMAQDRLGTSP